MLNVMGVFDANLPNQTNTQISSAQITELVSSTGAESSGPLDFIMGSLGMLGIAVSIFMSAIGGVLGFPGLLSSYGIPAPVTGMIMTMLVLIAVFGLAKLITNRSDKGME